ncbi:hypothetical protein BDB01DRAFT_814321 [Pilobolus umbonatus]|nr:hypothetical protein BDB01DRAFT_814321 [Pilobolus umbonatus]
MEILNVLISVFIYLFIFISPIHTYINSHEPIVFFFLSHSTYPLSPLSPFHPNIPSTAFFPFNTIIMSYYEIQCSSKHHSQQEPSFITQEKQKIAYLLDERKEKIHIRPTEVMEEPLPFLYDKSIQLPSPSSLIYTNNTNTSCSNCKKLQQNEVQYMKRIKALMTLVARQTKEIQHLREEDKDDMTIDSNEEYELNHRKRNKQT